MFDHIYYLILLYFTLIYQAYVIALLLSRVTIVFLSYTSFTIWQRHEAVVFLFDTSLFWVESFQLFHRVSIIQRNEPSLILIVQFSGMRDYIFLLIRIVFNDRPKSSIFLRLKYKAIQMASHFQYSLFQYYFQLNLSFLIALNL